MLCLPMILRLPKGGPARAGGYPALNLSLTLLPHPAQMPDAPAERDSYI